jgi:hypothetical protein
MFLRWRLGALAREAQNGWMTLCPGGVAKDPGGNGCPSRYSVPAGALLAAFAQAHRSALDRQ